PGPITSACSCGTNRLIRDGACPLLEVADLLAHFPEVAPGPVADPRMEPALPRRPAKPAVAAPATPLLVLPEAERLLLALVAAEPRHLDEITLAAGRPPGEVLALLCALELAGVVAQRPGRLFQRV
ncbi:MAG: hypothetical protein H0W67_04395, partial [Gemmatimonadales bacterium]|nr:hypothetical protein [Gemmatimonadales bacterium]